MISGELSSYSKVYEDIDIARIDLIILSYKIA